MPVPSPIKITRKGVEYISKVDRTKYLLVELTRAALRDVGKLIRRRMTQAARKQPGMGRGKRISNAFQYWVRKREGNLQVGVKHNTWYGVEQELGTNRQPRRGIIRTATFENIDEIRRIEGMYIAEIEDENRALGLIDEEETIGDEPEQ